jgi:uncharacterized membrane protein
MGRSRQSLFIRIAQALLLFVIGLSLYLIIRSIMRTPVLGCGGTGGCGEISTTRWAYWFGVPVSVLAVLSYLTLLAGSLLSPGMSAKSALFLQTAVAALCLIILASAVWFVSVQAAILHRYCTYCLMLHGGGVAASILLISMKPPIRWRLPILVAAASMALLIVGQIFQTDPLLVDISHATTPSDPSTAALAVGNSSGLPGRTLFLPYGIGSVNTGAVPVLGNPQAPYDMAVLFDFTCPVCRHNHALLLGAIARYPTQLCIALLPTPMESSCNSAVRQTRPEHVGACEYASVALALWRHNPDDFFAFCQAFIDSAPARPADQARAWAARRVGGEVILDQLLADHEIAQQIAQDTNCYGAIVRQTGRDEMPKLMMGSVVISGAPPTIDPLLQWLHRYCGLPGS